MKKGLVVLFALLLCGGAPLGFAQEVSVEEPPAGEIAAEEAAVEETAPNFLQKISEAFSGYYKVLTSFSKTTDTEEGIFGALQRLRLEFKPRLTDQLELNVTLDQEVLMNDFSNTSQFGMIRQLNQRGLSWLDGDYVSADTDHAYIRTALYRLYAKYETAHSRWIFGKQMIDWGRMRFFSPADIFNQPLPTSLEYDERLGFDALNVEFFSDDFTSLNLIYGPAGDPSGMSQVLRLFKKFDTYDTFVIAGNHQERIVSGFGFDGYLGQAGFRGEFTYTYSDDEEYARASIGLDHSFTEKTTGIVEYFYNGAANGDYDTFSTNLLDSRERLSLEKNLISFMVLHELTPLLKAKLATIVDPRGASVFVNPELRYNVRENLDVAAGAQLYVENEDSEFQRQQNLFYVEMKAFF